MRLSLPKKGVADYSHCYNGTGAGAVNTNIKLFTTAFTLGSSTSAANDSNAGSYIQINASGLYYIRFTDTTSTTDSCAIKLNATTQPLAANQYRDAGQLSYGYVVASTFGQITAVAYLVGGDKISASLNNPAFWGSTSDATELLVVRLS